MHRMHAHVPHLGRLRNELVDDLVLEGTRRQARSGATACYAKPHEPAALAEAWGPCLDPSPSLRALGDGSSSRVRGATQSPRWQLQQAAARQRARAAALPAGALRPAAEAVEEVQRCDSRVVAHLLVLRMHIRSQRPKMAPTRPLAKCTRVWSEPALTCSKAPPSSTAWAEESLLGVGACRPVEGAALWPLLLAAASAARRLCTAQPSSRSRSW